MVRLRRDLNLLHESVKEHVFAHENEYNIAFSDLTNQYNKNLFPFEIKITKAKDGARDILRYHLFSGDNLRIYQHLNVFYNDTNELNINSTKLMNRTNLLNMNTIHQDPGLLGNSQQCIL